MNVSLKETQKNLLFAAKCFYKTQCYSYAMKMFKSAIDIHATLSQDDEILFLETVKSLINPIRSLWRKLSELMLKEKEFTNIIRKRINECFSQLEAISFEILAILDQQLIPFVTDNESKVNYMRLQGDIFRYLAECALTESRQVYISNCDSAYREALRISLPVHSIVRLSLVLNRCVFLAEELNQTANAIAYAQEEMHRLMTKKGDVGESEYQICMAFMRRFHEQINKWSKT